MVPAKLDWLLLVDPVSTKYILGTPLFDRVTINLSNGKKLILEAKRETPASIYIRSLQWNGQPHPRSWFTHQDIADGGKFSFQLAASPNHDFGKSPEDRPKSVLEIPATS